MKNPNRSLRTLALFSLTLTLLSACFSSATPTQAPLEPVTDRPQPQPSETPSEAPETPSTPPSTGVADPPSESESPTDAPVSGVDLSRLGSVSLEGDRFLDALGETTQFKVILKDKSGQVISLDGLDLRWTSSRPGDFSVDGQGLATALKEFGFADIQVEILGTALKASAPISVALGIGGGGQTFTGGSEGETLNVSSGLSFSSGSSGNGFQVDGFIQGEIRVSSAYIRNQERPEVAMNDSGHAVVVWEADIEDGNSQGVFAQRYGPGGSPVGEEFLVNSFTYDLQHEADVAINDRGDFVIVWTSRGDHDGDSSGIFGQRYTSDGGLQGSEFQINTFTTDSQFEPDVAMDEDGAFVVVWRDSSSLDRDGDNSTVFYQRFNSDGSFQGSEFQVNTYTDGSQSVPAVAMNGAGDFVVTWQTQDGGNSGIAARIFSQNGVPQGDEFIVNTDTSNDERDPSIGMDDDGNFVVVWEASSSQDGSSDGVYGQRFDEEGNTLGEEFQVNTYTTSSQTLPDVGMNKEGDFVVVWESTSGQDGDGIGVFGQRFDQDGDALGEEFQVNTYTTSEQNYAVVAMNGDGGFMAVWESRNQDGSREGIYAKHFVQP